ncbi:hypothetical protein HDV57DRAFT_498702 [Trichoderma longibrachiatum]
MGLLSQTFAAMGLSTPTLGLLLSKFFFTLALPVRDMPMYATSWPPRSNDVPSLCVPPSSGFFFSFFFPPFRFHAGPSIRSYDSGEAIEIATRMRSSAPSGPDCVG